MVACFRQGYAVLPCTEQLRAKDLSLRLSVTQPRLVIADERNRDVLAQAGWDGDDGVGPVGRDDPQRAASVRGARPRGPVPAHVHLRHGRRAEGGGARPALPPRAAPAGRALARRGARRPRVVHRRVGVVEVGPQRLHRPVDTGRRRAAPRRALRPRRAPRHRRARGRRRPLHGAHGVPRDRQPGAAARAPEPARARGGRRGARPRRARHLARGDRAVDPRRLRPDRDRPADGQPARRDPAARLDGPPAPRRRPQRRRRRARARPGHRPDLLPQLPRRRAARRAVAHRRPRDPGRGRLLSTSRAAPTT